MRIKEEHDSKGNDPNESFGQIVARYLANIIPNLKRWKDYSEYYWMENNIPKIKYVRKK